MNQFEQFGIKEVADVQFIALEADTRLDVAAGDVVLYLDTLKISTLETTAEQTEARGGRGNPSLIIWDYGKEITVTLQDALFTPESLLVMTGGAKKISGGDNSVTIRKTKLVSGSNDLPTGAYQWLDTTTGLRGAVPAIYNASTDTVVDEGKTYYTRTGTEGSYVYEEVKSPTGNPSTSSYYELASGTGAPAAFPVRVFYDEEVATADAAYEVTIDAANFPGTYKIVGDTVVRNRNGKDTPFQFVIPKAKMGSEVTFTMEAEGDPSVFDMNLRVLRDDDGAMVKFIKYELE